MTLQPAGTRLDYTVTFLEMTAPPDWGWPHMPFGARSSLQRAEDPPAWWFLALYDAVGRDYAWEDMHALTPQALNDWLTAKGSELWVLMGPGWPEGFFVLRDGAPGVVDLAFFGVVPEAVGKGLGTWLLKTAIRTGWDRAGTSKMTVNTCTLDHPRALAIYQKHGFAPVRREDRTRVLTRDRDLNRIPS